MENGEIIYNIDTHIFIYLEYICLKYMYNMPGNISRNEYESFKNIIVFKYLLILIMTLAIKKILKFHKLNVFS